MSSNLLKRGSTYLSQDNARIINTDELIAARLEALAFKAVVTPKEEVLAGNVPQADEVMRLLADEDEEGFSGLSAPIVEIVDEEELSAASERAQSMITEAQAAAEEILSEARKEAEALKENAQKEGFGQGLEEGRAQAESELQTRMKLLDQKELDLNKEFESMLDEAEVSLVEKLSEIYEHVFRVDFSDKTEVLLYLLRSTIKKSPNCKKYLIRVSAMDYPEVEENSEDLRSLLIDNNPVLEVMEDNSLEEGQCLVEVDNGIFDCGIHTTLRELNRRIKELSYERN